MYFRFIIYRDQKHLMKVGLQEKLNYWHQSILGNWIRKLDHRFPTLDRSQKPIKLNLQSKKTTQNVKEVKNL
jgi:hypothetical protein